MVWLNFNGYFCPFLIMNNEYLSRILYYKRIEGFIGKVDNDQFYKCAKNSKSAQGCRQISKLAEVRSALPD